MADYRELVEKYKKRQHDTVVDAVAAGLSYADNVAVDLGLMDDTGVLTDALDTVSLVFPFALIAVTEQMKVILGKKDGKTGLSDAVFRMVKTGAALSVGAAAGAAGGLVAAVPAAIGTRALMDKYRSHSLTALRVARRTERLRSLRALNVRRTVRSAYDDQTSLPSGIKRLSADENMSEE